ncbi:uncharacterized protein LOC111412700 [Olea europaea var. sylvestris]|uniref:uncharacterized protein LOC111412700 n=1 Tax=Olea europaea var. sylvestris TaxID=158386 RepID=UPI000C1CE2E4|nr:uncharacterized protein LOC111412700 [Olea europaea var. sylvestris]
MRLDSSLDSVPPSFEPSRLELFLSRATGGPSRRAQFPSRPLWNNIMECRSNYSMPWMVWGDFNNVLKFNEKCYGANVTPYEVKDLENCCLSVGLVDLRSIGCFYTWTNGSIWSKLDRAKVNEFWMQGVLIALLIFLHRGAFPTTHLALYHSSGKKNISFRFFNMWTNHEDFHYVVSNIWNQVVRDTKQFLLCKKLQGLKGVLNKLNSKHFAHISSWGEHASKKLELAQKDLHGDPTNSQLQSDAARLRKEAMVLGEAKRNFYYQQAKCVYLKEGDKCTKFVHSLVKRNAKRNHIPAGIKRDGTYSSSQKEVVDNSFTFIVNCWDKVVLSSLLMLKF